MILADKGMGWRIAMRKVLQMTFGTSILAASCAVGRKNAKTTSLDQTKLDMIKGTQNMIVWKGTIIGIF